MWSTCLVTPYCSAHPRSRPCPQPNLTGSTQIDIRSNVRPCQLAQLKTRVSPHFTSRLQSFVKSWNPVKKGLLIGICPGDDFHLPNRTVAQHATRPLSALTCPRMSRHKRLTQSSRIPSVSCWRTITKRLPKPRPPHKASRRQSQCLCAGLDDGHNKWQSSAGWDMRNRSKRIE